MCHRWRPKGFIIWVYTPNVASLAHGMTVGTRYLSRQKQWPCYQHSAARSFSHLVAFVHIPAMTCRIQRVIFIGNEVFSSQSIYQRIITIDQAVAKNKAKGNNITRQVSGTPLSYVSWIYTIIILSLTLIYNYKTWLFKHRNSFAIELLENIYDDQCIAYVRFKKSLTYFITKSKLTACASYNATGNSI